MTAPAQAPFDLARIRADFPILRETVRGKRLAYLDNAATTQKPEAVLAAMDRYYRTSNANVHRAVHTLAERATGFYEASRDRIARWFNVMREQVVFGRGTTEAVNLVARSFLQPRLKAGDEILLTGMEHHSNIVPWQLAAQVAGAKIVAAPIDDAGDVIVEEWKKLLSSRTKLVAVAHVSNTLGTINPIAELARAAHARGVPICVDGAQAIAHTAVDFAALDVDFYACSSHKAYGPTGFGVLIAKREHLEAMEPWLGGGDMIRSVAFEGSTWNDVPYKFEAGTPDMAGAIGFAAALDYIASIGLDAIAAHEHGVLEYATSALAAVPTLRIIGTSKHKSGIISFTMEHAHAHDIGAILDQEGVAIRTGHHCTMPLMQRFGISATARASLAVYNGRDDVDQLVAALHKVHKLFR